MGEGQIFMVGTAEPTTETPPVVVSGPSFLDSIDWGSKLAVQDVKVYFATAGEVFDGKTSVGWNGYEVQQAMLAFQQFANISDLRLTITTDAADADLKLVNKEKAAYLGYFNPPGTRDAGVGVFNHTGTGWDYDQPGTGGLEQGGYGFISLIHEFGHAMGLAHPHDRGGSSTIWQGVTASKGSFGSFDLNQGIYSTMSYNDGWQTMPGPNNTDNAFGWQGTMMGFDIALLQQKYGANSHFAAGNDSYVLADANQSGSFFACLWDSGGTDAITYTGSRRATIDLRAATLAYDAGSGGYISNARGVFGGFTIAAGVVIENASGGSGDDALIGNAADNALSGNGGRDVILGMDGADLMSGGAGADRLTGGAGGDQFIYAALSDSGPIHSRFDTITDFDSQDVLNLSQIDAKLSFSANDAFVWINHAGFHAVEGELRWRAAPTGVMVLADWDGDGKADFKVMLEGVSSLSEADFAL